MKEVGLQTLTIRLNLEARECPSVIGPYLSPSLRHLTSAVNNNFCDFVHSTSDSKADIE